MEGKTFMKKGLFTAVVAALAITLCTPLPVNAANPSPSGTIVPKEVNEAAGIKEGMTVKEAEAVVGDLGAGDSAVVSYVAELEVVGGKEAAPRTVSPTDFDPKATYIVVLGKDGKVIDQGTSVTLDPAKAAYIFTLNPGETDWDADSIPVYRVYNPNNGGEHHYTMNAKERDALIAAHWNYEGIGWYSDDELTVPLFREYNPHARANNHNYTANAKEHEALLELGWLDEGIGWYAVSQKTEEPETQNEGEN